MIPELVEWAYARFDVAAACTLIDELTCHDRYQTSTGIAAAAELVASEAERHGLAGVEIVGFPADGTTRWWTFAAPPGWSPRRAELVLVEPAGGVSKPLLSYPGQPNGLAAYSASTPGNGVLCPLLPWSRLSDHETAPEPLLVLDAPASWPDVMAAAHQYGARGLVVGPGAGRRRDLVNRVELPPGSRLFAFSVTGPQLDQLLVAHASGWQAKAIVDADTAPDEFPVVVAHTPRGDAGRPALLTAHLCHPAPGANDNASGVATGLGVAALLADRPLRRRVSFVFGPEFLGVAAYLHHTMQQGSGPPLVAVNLDMVGEDQQRCGGPLILERSPHHLPSFLNAVAEECARSVPQAARSYSGAVPCDTWALRVTPSVGASDHGLLTDRAIGCPAVQLGHWPDRFRHTSGDTVDKVDPVELRRSASIAAATLAVTAEADGRIADRLADVVVAWGARRLLECLPDPGRDPEAQSRSADPYAAANQAYRLRRLRAVAVGSVRSLAGLGADSNGLDQRVHWVSRLADHVGETIPSAPESPASAMPAAPRRAWPGPFNLRGLLGACSPADRAWLERALDTSRERTYTIILAIAQQLDGATPDNELFTRAAVDSGLAIDADFAADYLALLARAGWVTRPEHPGVAA